jgi:hypothetical protein
MDTRRITRKGIVLAAGVALVLFAALLFTGTLDAHSPSTQPQTALVSIEPKAGTWKTFVIASGAAFRRSAPPDRAATATEIKQLQDLASQRNAAALDQIQYWNAGGPLYRWNAIAVHQALKSNLSTNMASRALALVHVAAYDAVIAAWDSKYAYNRPRPSEFDPSLQTVLPNPASPSYPSENAAVGLLAPRPMARTQNGPRVCPQSPDSGMVRIPLCPWQGVGRRGCSRPAQNFDRRHRPRLTRRKRQPSWRR